MTIYLPSNNLGCLGFRFKVFNRSVYFDLFRMDRFDFGLFYSVTDKKGYIRKGYIFPTNKIPFLRFTRG